MSNLISHLGKSKLQFQRAIITPIKGAKIKNSGNPKFWEEGGETGLLIHQQWEYKMVQLLWKKVCQFLTKINTNLPCDLVITLGHLSQSNVNLRLYTNLYTNVHSKVIHHIPRLEAIQMPLDSKWLNKQWYIPAMEKYSAIKRSELLIHATT